MDIDLDTTWIEEFEALDEPYHPYYLEDITTLKIHVFYVNPDNHIERIKEDTILLIKPNQVSKEEIIDIIQKNKVFSGKKYSAASIVKYNVDMDPSQIRKYIQDNEDPSDFLTPITNIETIILNPSISMFQDLNDLFFIFYENQKPASSHHSATRRIRMKMIHAHKKKTIRKIA